MASTHQTSSSSRPPLTAGIVGAGIAGLSAAVALRRAGFDEVQVYERSRLGDEVGAAISAPPNATVALRRWGFDFAAAGAVPNLCTRYAAAGDLGTVFRSEYEDIETAMGAPSLSFHRVDLHRGLRVLATGGDLDRGRGEGEGEGAGGRDKDKGTPVAIRLGCEIRSVDCENGVLTLADGSRVQKDLVVIADGARSSLLADFLGYPPPSQPTGRSIYRWLVSMDDVMADPELAEQYRDKLPGFLGWFDAARRILWVNYTCRGGSVLNNAVVHDSEDYFAPQSPLSDTGGLSGHGTHGERREDEVEDERDTLWHVTAAKETVLQTLSNFHPAARRIVSMASEDGIRVHRLYKRPPLESFVRGRAVIIGDAAHVMVPTHAAGGAVAIESASVLEALFTGLEGSLGTSSNSFNDMTGGEETNSERLEQGSDGTRERVIQERLQLFDKLRVPRCNLTMLASNAGPEWLRIPGVEQEIRRFYHGPLPSKESLPWSDEFREVLFHYDAFEAAIQALRDEKAKKNGGIQEQ
ncbi:FAD/NAD(P)-binding domain-containing protein [Nemania sp. NC0429]|nr:FAD/NAD(P)-binding domain-containing protein [Nemania sp. NC0429]